ncbi:hypothetical protein [Fonticella tunisiensis]|uniref:Uncharacterized protein n=1 Tax=Fonticella tunisiensis TaxID=1096341 RepID=A0A4R7K810_9CLOT|nr:hypothetical protein [Fonticella tunisiensis]TDT46104.1 hypothetical protein EDD71_1359 [Fonticella tunisiensis]
MFGLVFVLSLAASAAYVNIKIINDTERNKNRDGIRFLLIFLDIIGTFLILKFYNTLTDGVQIEFSGAIRFMLMISGFAALFITSAKLIVLLKRYSAARKGLNFIVILDFVISIVILGLYFIV